MELPEALTPLLRRAAAGEQQAAEEILHVFGPRVLRAVRLRLSRKLRRDFDSMDFVQAVWMSFFDNLSDLDRFTDGKALCGYLAKMAERKVQMSARRRATLKRDMSREQALDSTLINSAELTASTASPSEEFVALETWQRLLGTMPLHHQRILFLRAQGHNQTDIATLVGVAEITVRRVLAAAKLAIEK